MALTTQMKTAIGTLNHVNRALAIMYCLGVDNLAMIKDLGLACVARGWPNLDADALTNEQIALALLRTIKDQLQHVWVTQATPAVEQAAATAARTAKKAEIVSALTAVNPLPEMPEAEA